MEDQIVQIYWDFRLNMSSIIDQQSIHCFLRKLSHDVV